MIETLIEIFIIDPLLWNPKEPFKKDGKIVKSDKPASTVLWAIMTTGIACIVQWVLNDNWALSYVLLALSFRFAFFNYIINWSRVGKQRQHWAYLSNKGFDKFMKKLPILLRVFFQVWAFIVGVMQYLYLSGRIYQDYNILFDIPIF